MTRLLRLVVAIALGVAAVAGAGILVPLAYRDIYRHGSSTVANRIPPLRAVTKEGSTIYAANGAVLATLEPPETSKPVALSQINPILIRAVLDTEDHRFFQHGGVDFPSMMRAFLSDSSGGNFQGGSTITQQLVKQVYLTSERKVSRKLKEAVLANRLQKIYTKRQILNAYLNIIYLGSGAYGVEAAAEAYWGEPASRLTLPQAALLAGLIQAPSGYDPVTDPTAARIRRSQVLSRMLHYKDITRRQYRRANAAPLPTSVATRQQQLTGIDAYYVAEVERTLLARGSPLGSTPDQRDAALFGGGLKIYTNLQPTAQAQAEAAVAKDTPQNATAQGIEENLVSIDPSTGAVTALIGGQNYQKDQFDPATQGREQAGSGFKIFTLLAGLMHGQSIQDLVDATSPCSVPFPANLGYTQGHSPGPAHNDEGDGQQGVTTVLNATAQSLNCAYFRMAHQVGLSNVVAEAEELGIPRSEMKPYAGDPSIVLGAAGVTPVQMAGAYATLADGGVFHAPSFVNHIVDRSGSTIYTQPTKGKRVLPPNVVAEADQAFVAVVNGGTGYAAAIPGRPVAGKTGTTNGPTSAWFNGYTPQLETTVWMGSPTGGIARMVVDGVEVYGGTFPTQTVHDYLAAALATTPVKPFPPVNPAYLPRRAYIPEDTLTDQSTALQYTAP
ncbi:MAG TPA: transglycosylase domain-containing protein, partial [Acidimicrobiales bacterium]|nr:transglycosylase domain-containing protein [Acidimicrobiales bacterium]